MFWFVLLLIGGGGFTGWYQYGARVSPFAMCKPCEGKGYQPVTRLFAIRLRGDQLYRECPHCETTGRRLKWAARHSTRNDKSRRDRLNGRRTARPRPT